MARMTLGCYIMGVRAGRWRPGPLTQETPPMTTTTTRPDLHDDPFHPRAPLATVHAAALDAVLALADTLYPAAREVYQAHELVALYGARAERRLAIPRAARAALARLASRPAWQGGGIELACRDRIEAIASYLTAAAD